MEGIVGRLGWKSFYRRNLPHIQLPGCTLFITFRLAGSIPAEAAQSLIAEGRRVDAALARITDLGERKRRRSLEQRRLFGKWDAALDTAAVGPLWLGDPRIAALMADCLQYRDGQVYDLDAYCIMPNHVHLVCTPLVKEGDNYYSISSIMHSLKGYVARQANALLGREGVFWQHENYDHVVRDEGEWQRIVYYVLNNPVKAGLVQTWRDWKWSYCKQL